MHSAAKIFLDHKRHVSVCAAFNVAFLFQRFTNNFISTLFGFFLIWNRLLKTQNNKTISLVKRRSLSSDFRLQISKTYLMACRRNLLKKPKILSCAIQHGCTFIRCTNKLINFEQKYAKMFQFHT